MTVGRPDGPGRVWTAVSGDGSGPRIILIHGSLDRSAGLLRLARRLDTGHRVVRYDRRGYGRSHRLDGPYDVRAHLDDLASLLDRTPTVLFGHSFGGALALAAAIELAPTITGVAVYEPPMVWEPWWPRASNEDHGDPEDLAEAFMRRLIGDQRWDRLGAATRRARRAEGPALVAELESLGRDWCWDLGAVRCPVLVMRGALAREHHQRATDEIVASCRDANLVVVEGAGHFGPNTHPADVAVALGDFAPVSAVR